MSHPPAVPGLPEWPTVPPAHGGVVLREFRVSFAIADVGTDQAVGSIGLRLRELPAGRAGVGYAVAPAHRGRGIARDALTALTAYAWTIPALHRIELYIEPWNTGSVRTAEAAGYAREGLLRSHHEIGGVRRDMLLFAAVRS